MPHCQQCSSEYSRIATHWTHSSSCEHPDFTEHEWEILQGLLMGDGHVDDSPDRNPRFTVNMTNEAYLNWLDSIFGKLSAGVRHERTPERSAEQSGRFGNGNPDDYSTIYRWTTIRHPSLSELRDWYSSGTKVWPDVNLTPTMIKHLYVSDGNYEHHGTSNHIRIHCSKEKDYKDKVSKMFSDAGYPIQAWRIRDRKGGGKKVAIDFSVNVSKELWNDMGNAPPGFKYKWPEQQT